MGKITLPIERKASFDKTSDEIKKAWFGIGVDLEIDFDAYHSRRWVLYKGRKYHLQFEDSGPLINDIYLRPILSETITGGGEEIDLVNEGFDFEKVQAFASGYYHLANIGKEKYAEARASAERGEYPITWI